MNTQLGFYPWPHAGVRTPVSQIYLPRFGMPAPNLEVPLPTVQCYGDFNGGVSELGDYGADPVAQYQRLLARYNRLRAKYAVRGRRFLGIRVGSGDKRLANLKAKLDALAPIAQSQDPQQVYSQAYQQALASAGSDADAAETSLAVPASGGSDLLLPLLIVGGLAVVGLALAKSGGSETPAKQPRSNPRRIRRVRRHRR